MEPTSERPGVVFGVQGGVPRNGNNAAQRREHDRRLGTGTMSRTGATCPTCGAIMTMEDIRYEGRAGRLGAVMTTVVVNGPKGKEYRLPTAHELAVADVTEDHLKTLYADIPFGLPDEPLPSKEALGFRIPLYGFDAWRSCSRTASYWRLESSVTQLGQWVNWIPIQQRSISWNR